MSSSPQLKCHKKKMKSKVLFESKVFAIVRLLISFTLISFVTIGFIAIGYWYLGLIFVLLIVLAFRKTPLKVSFSEDEFKMKYLFKVDNGRYEEIKKIEFHYSGPFAYPKLIIYWKNSKVGFEWGSDKKYLESMLKFFKSKKIILSDPQLILKNYVDVKKLE